jgi:hypothetical protein
MQLNMTFLNRCTQFNRSIFWDREVLDLGGAPHLLDVVSWGLGLGYALDQTAGMAWLGSPGTHGWHWEPRREIAPAVRRMISIYQDKTDPQFIVIPAMVGHRAAKPETN